MKPLLFCCCIFLFCRCTNEVFNPVDLFVIRDSIKDLSLSQQKARIKYGEMLQVQVKNDSLVMPIITGECPLVYKAYVQDFVRIMNAHLKKNASSAKVYDIRINTDKFNKETNPVI